MIIILFSLLQWGLFLVGSALMGSALVGDVWAEDDGR